MNVSTNQTGNTVDRGTRATRDIKPAKVIPITGGSFEQWFCAVLIALIFATVVIVSAVLTHLTGPFVERLDGHVAIDSANGAGQEKPRTLQLTTATSSEGSAGYSLSEFSWMKLC